MGTGGFRRGEARGSSETPQAPLKELPVPSEVNSDKTGKPIIEDLVWARHDHHHNLASRNCIIIFHHNIILICNKNEN